MATEYKVKCLTKQEGPVADVDINDAIRSVLDEHEQWSFWEMLAGSAGGQVAVFWVYLLFKRSVGMPLSKLSPNRTIATPAGVPKFEPAG
ncbi:MAG: hypothetical protein L0387_14005 [Acidobacteria bacterium]|nr:hypothetical protein [Acidobacteriota bacterium]MCI0721198.1 hypothetical protein [Acidobacteriota bacterium]